jgi:hypothetical protein
MRKLRKKIAIFNKNRGKNHKKWQKSIFFFGKTIMEAYFFIPPQSIDLIRFKPYDYRVWYGNGDPWVPG